MDNSNRQFYFLSSFSTSEEVNMSQGDQNGNTLNNDQFRLLFEHVNVNNTIATKRDIFRNVILALTGL